MTLQQIIKTENCRLLDQTSKVEVLNSMMEDLHARGYIRDIEELKKEIFYREELMSTGLGLGIAIPHVRFAEVKDPVVALGIQPKGIPDYQSLDSETVKIVIMIIVGKDQHKQHLQLLSQLMAQLKDAPARQALVDSSTPEEIFRKITAEHE